MKHKKVLVCFALVVLMSTLLFAATNQAKAQETATIIMLGSVGGSTSPAAGTTTYSSGSSVTLTAYPTSADEFAYWEISSTAGISIDTANPDTIVVNDTLTYTIQPVFQFFDLTYPIISTAPTSSSTAVVIVLAAVGGTTTPAPGTYELTSAASLSLTAIADTGWKFDNWVIGGYPLSHGAYSFTDTPTNNPYNVNHGYGYTYSYQPVFSLVSTSPTPTIPEFSSAGVIILVVILIAALLATGVYTHRKRH